MNTPSSTTETETKKSLEQTQVSTPQIQNSSISETKTKKIFSLFKSNYFINFLCFIVLVVYVYYIYQKTNQWNQISQDAYSLVNITKELYEVECTKKAYVDATNNKDKCLKYTTIIAMNVEQVISNKFLNDFMVCSNNRCYILSTVISANILISFAIIIGLIYLLVVFFIRKNQIERKTLDYGSFGGYYNKKEN